MLKRDFDDLIENGEKGDWAFVNGDTRIALFYSDNKLSGIVVLPLVADAGKHWQWNGNKESPTLSPSILVHPYPGWTEGWHGWLRDGKLVNA